MTGFSCATKQTESPVSTFHKRIPVTAIFLAALIIGSCSTPEEEKQSEFNIPEDYLEQPANIPVFWKTSLDEISRFLDENVRKGKVEVIGTSAGGRPIRAVFYGNAREGKGTSTFSGSLGYRDVRAYRGPDHEKMVYVGMSAVHGGEFEGIVGTVNLLSILETGRDLRGKEWPEILAAAAALDRLIVIPVMNPDGRARVPLRMEKYNGTSNVIHEFFNTGGKPDFSLIGWPDVKEFIPLDFKTTSFPGGYPNDAGVNLMHDDFFGNRQPETQALFDLVAREKPDLILNMHTGAPGDNYFMRMHRPLCEPVLEPTFGSFYQKVHTALATRGLQSTHDPEIEAKIDLTSSRGLYNLDAALNLHSGALCAVVESPSHSFSGTNRAGEVVVHTPEMLLDAQLVCHQEALKFLQESGGRSKWTPSPNKRAADSGLIR
jgi:hypothetical protein